MGTPDQLFEQPHSEEGHNSLQIRLALRALAADERSRNNPDGLSPTRQEKLLEEAANRIQRLENLSTLLGLLAPQGTAPRAALEHIYQQAATSPTESPAVVDFREMLTPHLADWTPALADIVGLELPPGGAEQ